MGVLVDGWLMARCVGGWVGCFVGCWLGAWVGVLVCGLAGG